MAKIIYFKSPILKDYSVIDRTDVSIISVLKELGIEKDSLSIQINGDVPEDLDGSIILKKDDSLVIKRVVFGSSDSKRTLGTVVQLAALVAATVLSGGGASPWLVAGVLSAGSIVSGVLYANALAMDRNAIQSNDKTADISSNSYSLTNTSNTARPNLPVPIVMGSHRVIPDFYAKPFRSVYGEENTVGENPPTVETVYPGISLINLATISGNSWITIPAGFVEDNGGTYGTEYDRFPQYDIKISPLFFGIDRYQLTPELEIECRNTFKNIITSMWAATSGSHNHSSNINFNFSSSDVCALAIFHSDPSDPYYVSTGIGRYNILWTIIRAYELNRKRVSLAPSITPTAYNYYSDIQNFFDGNFNTYSVGLEVFSYEQRFFRGGNDVLGSFDVTVSTSIQKDLVKSGGIAGYYYPSSISAADTITNAMLNLGSYLLTLNDSVFVPSMEYQIISFGITSVKEEGIDYSTQVFNFGLGDLDISERQIGSTDVGLSESISHFSPINKNNWKIPDFNHSEIVFPVKFYSKVMIGDEKKLSNINTTDSIVPSYVNNQYNFIYYEGAIGQPIIYFSISGKIYGTSTGTGFVSNNCVIQIQWKKRSDNQWTSLGQFGVFNIQNDNPKVINFLTSVGSTSEGFLDQDDRLMIRIRKVTLDSDNNNENKVCDLYVKRVSAVSVDERDIDLESMHRPMNLEGLFMTSLLSDASQTNKYSAMVESKCWYYNFETSSWVWGKTRNPAWWFLFYARGGFENPNADGTFTFPYSPTFGWVNYPNHPDNTVHLFGAGYSDDRIDITQILQWAQFCDEKNLKIDLVLTDDTSVADVLERIANVGRGSVTDYNSKLSVVYEDKDQVPSCLFGMGNIKAGSFSVDYLVGDQVGKVIASYVDREDWETKQVESLVPFSEDYILNVLPLSLEGITTKEQAQRECNLLAARQFYQRRKYSWEVDIEGKLVKRGDLVYLSHDSTQYGVSGRIREFIFEDGEIKGFYSSAILNESLEYVTVRDPIGVLRVYECSSDGDKILFTNSYPINLAPYYINKFEVNYSSNFQKSIAEDFVFIAGEKETTGKIVRISSIESISDFDFKLTAVDEDPAMWAYEFNEVEPPESYDDSEVELVVENAEVVYFENEDKFKILWNGKNCDLVQIINKSSGLPIESSGSYTFSNGEAVFELSKGKYILEIRPFAIGTPFRSMSKEVTVWLR